jgi:hypothetical protein
VEPPHHTRDQISYHEKGNDAELRQIPETDQTEQYSVEAVKTERMSTVDHKGIKHESHNGNDQRDAFPPHIHPLYLHEPRPAEQGIGVHRQEDHA